MRGQGSVCNVSCAICEKGALTRLTMRCCICEGPCASGFNPWYSPLNKSHYWELGLDLRVWDLDYCLTWSNLKGFSQYIFNIRFDFFHTKLFFAADYRIEVNFRITLTWSKMKISLNRNHTITSSTLNTYLGRAGRKSRSSTMTMFFFCKKNSSLIYHPCFLSVIEFTPKIYFVRDFHLARK